MKTVDFDEKLLDVNADGYEKLGFAVILQAIADYKELQKIDKKGKRYDFAVAEMNRIRQFFRSDRFNNFNPSDVDGEDLIAELDACCD